MSMMNSQSRSGQSGFTVIELVVVGVLLLFAAFLAFTQMNNLQIANDDLRRKTAINAIYYALEEVYYKKHGSYPEHLDTKTLPSVDPDLFTDPDGFTLGEEVLSEDELKKLVEESEVSEKTERRLASVSAGKGPNYHYEPTNCDNKGNCKSYTLRAELVNEAEYVKKSRNR